MQTSGDRQYPYPTVVYPAVVVDGGRVLISGTWQRRGIGRASIAIDALG